MTGFTAASDWVNVGHGFVQRRIPWYRTEGARTGRDGGVGATREPRECPGGLLATQDYASLGFRKGLPGNPSGFAQLHDEPERFARKRGEAVVCVPIGHSMTLGFNIEQAPAGHR